MKICLNCKTRFESQDWSCPDCGHSPRLVSDYFAFHPELAMSEDEVQYYPFEQMYELEARHFWFRERNRLIIWAIEKYFSGAKKFLEIGCGSGFVLRGIEDSLPEMHLYGSEISVHGLTFASQRLRRAELFQMDAREIPFEGEFDAIGAFDVLEHILQDREVLEQMYQSVQVGGGILLTVPMHPMLWSPTDDYYHHMRRYRLRELVGKVTGSGFSVVKTIPFVSFLFPLMILSRLKLKILKNRHDPLSEMKVGDLSNAILERVMKFESRFIRSGLGMPFGASLLLIARKI